MPDLFSTLPNELMDNVLCRCSEGDLARARLVSSRFRESAGVFLFRKLTFCPTPQSATNVTSIISSEHLREYVRDFCFSDQTSLQTLDLYEFLDSSNTLPAQALDTVRLVSLLKNLTVLRCHHDLGPSAYIKDDYLFDKFDTYRGEVLTNLIVGLAERGASSKKLETLDIVNLPCRPQRDLTDHESFSALLGNLQTLLLRLDYNWANDKPYRDPPRADESHEFFTRLPRAWLAPAATNLTYLALGASELWGYILKVDFRGVHFPQLQSLVMQNFVFSHDWQLEWILSHTSLQKLCLFQCRILTHARWFGEKDNEGYPISFSSLRAQNYLYAKSWHHYYQHFSSLLGKLRCFTTMRDDGSAQTDCVGGYQTFHEHGWVRVIPEPDRGAEDEEALKHLKATTNRRSRH